MGQRRSRYDRPHSSSRARPRLALGRHDREGGTPLPDPQPPPRFAAARCLPIFFTAGRSATASLSLIASPCLSSAAAVEAGRRGQLLGRNCIWDEMRWIRQFVPVSHPVWHREWHLVELGAGPDGELLRKGVIHPGHPAPRAALRHLALPPLLCAATARPPARAARANLSLSL